jgi:hypothetical protein
LDRRGTSSGGRWKESEKPQFSRSNFAARLGDQVEPVTGIRPRRSICRQMLKLTATSEGSRAIMTAAKAIDENTPPCREGALFERRGEVKRGLHKAD